MIMINKTIFKSKNIGVTEYLSKSYLDGTNRTEENLQKISNYEKATDNIQGEVTNIICKVMEKEISAEQSSEAASYIKISDELERMAP